MTYINYKLENGKTKRIPQGDIDRIMSGLKVDQDEAIEIWLEDEGILINEEQNALDQKAKASKITATIHQARSAEVGAKRKVERKPDLNKEEIITAVAETLQNLVENVEITNKSKLVEFDFKGEHYKLDLIKQRKPK